jgi:hypothetical protein
VVIITLPDGRLRIMCLLHSCGWYYTIGAGPGMPHRPDAKDRLRHELDLHMEEFHT